MNSPQRASLRSFDRILGAAPFGPETEFSVSVTPPRHGGALAPPAPVEGRMPAAQGKVATSAEGFCELVETLESPKGTKIGLETGTQAMWVSRLLSGLEMEPAVIDAREVRHKGPTIRELAIM